MFLAALATTSKRSILVCASLDFQQGRRIMGINLSGFRCHEVIEDRAGGRTSAVTVEATELSEITE